MQGEVGLRGSRPRLQSIRQGGETDTQTGLYRLSYGLRIVKVYLRRILLAHRVEKFIVPAHGFEQDVQIWRHKARIDNPLLVEEDGPVYQLRRWYQQFYVDAANVQSDMVDRFEFELDTTRPYKAWMKEVEANMAVQAASTGSV